MAQFDLDWSRRPKRRASDLRPPVNWETDYVLRDDRGRKYGPALTGFFEKNKGDPVTHELQYFVKDDARVLILETAGDGIIRVRVRLPVK